MLEKGKEKETTVVDERDGALNTSNPGDGDATQLRIGEAKKESTTKTLFQHVFRLLTANKTDDRTV